MNPSPPALECHAFDAYGPPSEVHAGDTCAWVPDPGPPTTLTVVPRPDETRAGRCAPVWTTRGGLVLAPVGAEAVSGPFGVRGHAVWRWMDSTGRTVAESSLDVLPDLFAPQHAAALAPHLVTCNLDFKDTNVCYGSMAVDSVAPGREPTTVALGDAAPEWEVGGFAVVPLAPSAAGIALAVRELETPFDPARSRWRVRLRVVDEDAVECGIGPVLASGKPPAPITFFAVDDHLRVLLLLERYFPYRLTARWFALDGAPLTDEFDVAIPVPDCDPSCSWTGGQLWLTGLIGGGIAYQRGLQYLAVFPSGEARYEQAPAWLTRMNGYNMERVGDQGYAFVELGAPRAGLCKERFEFVSISGRPCGRVTLDTGGSCTTSAMVGRDGTVFLQDGRVDPCSFFMWPRLFE